jgi:hypothetical protein
MKIINQPTGLDGVVYDDLYDDKDLGLKNNGANSRNRHSKHLKNNWQSIRFKYLK